MRILIADDDPGILNALKASLVSKGCEIITAGDGEQALRIIKEERESGRSFHMVITDLRMPGLNGLDLIRVAGKAFPRIPMVLMTAHGDLSVEKAVAAIKGCSYLEKPFKPGTLQELILRGGNHPLKEECE
jgi:DNA-binding NtrC family response regulator